MEPLRIREEVTKGDPPLHSVLWDKPVCDGGADQGGVYRISSSNGILMTSELQT